jgi:hypothetical protein
VTCSEALCPRRLGSGNILRRGLAPPLEGYPRACPGNAACHFPGSTLVQPAHAVDPVSLHDGDEDVQGPARAEEAGDPAEHRSIPPQDRPQKRSPGELDADLVSAAGQLVGERLGRCHDEEGIRQLGLVGPPEAVMERRGIGVEANHKSVGVCAGAAHDEAPVPGA